MDAVRVIVIGAGPVGATFALLARRFGLDAQLLEARAGPSTESRTLALSHGSREILARAGAWDGCANGAAEIHRIHCSQQGGFGRALLDRGDAGLPALGYVLPYSALQEALDAALQHAAIPVRFGARVAGLAEDAGGVRVDLEDGETLHADALVLADGGANLSKVGAMKTQDKDYGQSALLAHLTADRGQANTAYERFTPVWPAALLPAREADGYSMVWVAAPERVEALKTLRDADFLAAFQAHFGSRAGRFRSVGARRSFPLRMRLVEPRATARIATIGNAAQALHPVAGQGFNLGLRDALGLAEAIAAGGATDGLAAYATARGRDVGRTAGFTNLLVDLFGTDHLPTRAVRGAGLLLLDLLPPARRALARRMSFGTAR